MQLDLAIVYDALADADEATRYGHLREHPNEVCASMRSFCGSALPPFFATRQAERRNRPWRRVMASVDVDPRHVPSSIRYWVYEVGR